MKKYHLILDNSKQFWYNSIYRNKGELMITSFESLAERRLITINYHKKDSQQYINSLNYFEYARIYFEKNGFPEDNRRVYQSGKRKGQKVGWSDKEEKQQKDDIRKFIYEKQLQKFKSKRKSQ